MIETTIIIDHKKVASRLLLSSCLSLFFFISFCTNDNESEKNDIQRLYQLFLTGEHYHQKNLLVLKSIVQKYLHVYIYIIFMNREIL